MFLGTKTPIHLLTKNKLKIMSWIKILELILSVAASISKYIENNTLLDAGRALAIRESIENAKKQIEKANVAKSEALVSFDADNELYGKSDPNRRD